MARSAIRVTTAIAALTAGLSAVLPTAGALPTEQPTKAARAATTGNPVTGIPTPCRANHAYPEGATPAEVRRQLQAFSGMKLVGGGWDAGANAGIVRIVWETLDGLNCTDYLDVIRRNNPKIDLNAAPTRSWAWGDWGLTRPGALTLDFAKWQQAYQGGDKGRLVRILVHELGHAYSRSPQAQASYNGFNRLYARGGNFGPYAYNLNENFSEVIGYYVARCAKDNPYQDKKFAPYYQHVKSTVFKGKEFGPAPGAKPNCSLATPAPARTTPQAPVRLPKDDLEPQPDVER
ncbi:hypothetical protein [Luteococcus peritonei]|uniref:Metalloprotease n=1 Tax=Luteococcus peritonei TaxID=88874 RepID=A0ABW4RT85_9ACTN